jgi:hypothetical protein
MRVLAAIVALSLFSITGCTKCSHPEPAPAVIPVTAAPVESPKPQVSTAPTPVIAATPEVEKPKHVKKRKKDAK